MGNMDGKWGSGCLYIYILGQLYNHSDRCYGLICHHCLGICICICLSKQ